MTIYVWHTGHPINETVSQALHAGIPQNILYDTEFAANYVQANNKHVAVGYGILRGTATVFNHNKDCGVDFWEVDRGYINPRHYDGYYRISKNGLQAVYTDIDLPDDRLNKLNFTRAEWYNPKGHVLVCPPSDYIEYYYNLPLGGWLKAILPFLQDVNHRVIVRSKSDTAPLNDHLKDAYCVITFNSNVAVDAAIKGIPVVTGEYSVVGNWCGNKLHDVVTNNINVSDPGRVDKLLRFLSYNQFTLDEISKGIAWRILNGQ